MTAEGSHQNFFLILGLDPAAPWNQAVCQRALSDMRNLWSTQTQGVKGTETFNAAKRGLALIHDAEQTLLHDPEGREKERQAALRQTQAEHRSKLDQFTRKVDLKLEKDYLWDVEYEGLCSELASLGGDPGLRRKLDRAEKRPLKQPTKDTGRLDAATERNLRTHLATLGLPDLYAALRQVEASVTEATSLADLLAAADKLYRKARHMPNKNLPDVGAMQNLSGIAQRVFGTDDMKKRHDISTRLFPLHPIIAQYEKDLADTRAIDSKQFDRFLREAAQKGVDIDVARDLFAAHFREKNWSVDMPSSTAQTWLRAAVRCPACDHINDPGNAHCSSCGRALREPCPRCNAVLPATDRACPRCGFPVVERPYAQYLAEEIEAAIDAGGLDSAARLLARGTTLWPIPEGKADPVADRMRRSQARLADLRAKQQAELEELRAKEEEERAGQRAKQEAERVKRQAELAEERTRQQAALEEKIGQASVLMGEHRYHGALLTLRGLTPAPPSVLALIRRCEEAVRESDRLSREARVPGVPDERRALLYAEALRLCADNTGTRDALARISPPPPRRLRAEPDLARKVVRLTWDPAPGLDYSSVIFRADGPVPPAAPNGQYRRAAVHGKGEWEDTAALVGLPMWYAVYTERDITTTLSRHGVVTAQAVLLTADPQFTVRPGEGRVELSWTLPDNALGLEISRHEIGPDDAAIPQEPVTLPLPGLGARSLIDRDVRNGTSYRYVARTRFGYQSQGGQFVECQSAGTAREVTPTARPELPGPVQARGSEPDAPTSLYKVELRWQQTAADGVVKVVRSVPDGASILVGHDFPESALGRSHLVIEPDQRYDFWWFKKLPLCSYTPVLFLNGRCYAGSPRHFAMEPEVTDLRAQASATAARVTWSWPDEAEGAVVAWEAGAEPFDPAAASDQKRVARGPGQRTGQLDVPAQEPELLIVRVAVIRRSDGIDYITSGVTTSVRPPAEVPAEPPAPDQPPSAGPAPPDGCASGGKDARPRSGSGRRFPWTRDSHRGQHP
jgi:Double zinc ribbon